MRRRQTSSLLFLIPLVIGFLFAALMVYLAITSTETAREHYKANRAAENIPRLFRSLNPGINQPPLKERNWFVKYEVQLLIVALLLAILGIRLSLLVIGRRLPDRNPLNLDDTMRRSLLAMVCSFILSPAGLMLYLWALRVGIIG